MSMSRQKNGKPRSCSSWWKRVCFANDAQILLFVVIDERKKFVAGTCSTSLDHFCSNWNLTRIFHIPFSVESSCIWWEIQSCIPRVANHWSLKPPPVLEAARMSFSHPWVLLILKLKVANVSFEFFIDMTSLSFGFKPESIYMMGNKMEVFLGFGFA